MRNTTWKSEEDYKNVVSFKKQTTAIRNNNSLPEFLSLDYCVRAACYKLCAGNQERDTLILFSESHENCYYILVLLPCLYVNMT
jgi:hypothetical protein